MEQTLSLSCYIIEWMRTFKAYSVKQSTYDRLLTSVKALEGFQIASMPIGEITSVHIQKYVNELAEYGYGLSTIKKQMRIVTAPLKQAAALYQIPADPAVGIRLPSRSNVLKAERTVEAYSQEEQKALWVLIDTHQRAGYATVALMLETGLRVGEALALRWRDINLSRKRLHSTRFPPIRLSEFSFLPEATFSKRNAQPKHIHRKNKKPSGCSLIHTRGQVMRLSA